MRKWPDRPHWEFDATHLGQDHHGDWFGLPAGTTFTRPGARFDSVNDQVCLVPAEVDGNRPGWVATFHGPGGFLPIGGHRIPIDLYVDMTTPATWDDSVVHAVDLDLDVVRGVRGRVWVDDEDEFAAHRRDYAYPQHVVDLALAACADVSVAARHREPPFDGDTHLGWLGLVGR